MTEINGNIDSAQTSADTQQTSGDNAEVNNTADNDFVVALFDGEEPETGAEVQAADGEPVAAAEEPEDDKGGKESDPQAEERKFTLKVLGQDKEVGLEEMQALAQKGADYDRIRAGYDDYKNQVAQQQEQLAAWQRLVEISGMGPQDFINQFNEQIIEEAVETRKKEIIAKEMISDDVAERIARAEVRLENQQKTAEAAARREAIVKQQPARPPQPTAEQQQEAQMQVLAAEIAKLQQDFPELSEPGAKFPDEVVQAVQDGKATLSDAYRNWVIQKQKDEIKQMEQTAKNKAKSVGSLKSDGTGNEVDEFTEALFAD